ncbi:MAG: DUF2726 domain-containing protein [Sphingomonadaceae bacterium]|nr:DUF2726 domain-containing protein [Sphingomonadaceae bacterium]
MVEDFHTLLDNPVLLLATLLVGAIIGIVVERLIEGQRLAERRVYWQARRAQQQGKVPVNRKAGSVQASGNANDAAEQLRRVMNAEFSERALLNKSEAVVFKALDAAVVARNPGWQVMAQVSLGEFLASKDRDAYLAINSKRVDFALMDETARVRHTLEYQGSGHHLLGGEAAARDAVKKEALRKAGIGYHEVVAGHTTPAELKRLVERLVPAPA